MIKISVPVNERSQGVLQVLTAAQDLLLYTIKICGNEKIFPKKQRWLLADRLIGEATDFVTNIRMANALKLDEYPEERKRLQKMANAHLQSIFTLIDASYNAFKISSDKIAYWSKLAGEASKLLAGWIKSDKNRLK